MHRRGTIGSVPEVPSMGVDMYPRISMIMASYNQGAFIEQAIRSFTGQRYPEKELIVIDGGSTDNTADVLAEYRKYISSVTIEEDRGMYHARNKGIFLASGDLVGFLNADDLLASDALEKVGGYFMGHPETEMLVGLCRGIHEDGREMVRTVLGNFTINRRNYFFKMQTIPDQSTFYRRNVFAHVGLYDCRYRFGADTELKNRCLTMDVRVNQVFDVIAFWRIHNSTLTGRADLKWKRLREAIKVNSRYAGHPFTYYNARLLLHYLCIDYLKKMIGR